MGKLTFHPPDAAKAKKKKSTVSKRKLHMKGSLLDEVCIDESGKPYLPSYKVKAIKSPEPRKTPAAY